MAKSGAQVRERSGIRKSVLTAAAHKPGAANPIRTTARDRVIGDLARYKGPGDRVAFSDGDFTWIEEERAKRDVGRRGAHGAGSESEKEGGAQRDRQAFH